jgi:transcriptional regulator with XRE-family HTH domain
MNNVYKILKNLRIRYGYSLRDVEKVTGITASYLCRVEHGIKDIRLSILFKLLALYEEREASKDYINNMMSKIF